MAPKRLGDLQELFRGRPLARLHHAAGTEPGSAQAFDGQIDEGFGLGGTVIRVRRMERPGVRGSRDRRREFQFLDVGDEDFSVCRSGDHLCRRHYATRPPGLTVNSHHDLLEHLPLTS